MGYRLTPAASDDLEQIWLYTLAQFDVEQAERYIAALVRDFALAATDPPWASDHKRFRRLRSERHVIYYLCETTNQIVIVRILHERMDPGRNL